MPIQNLSEFKSLLQNPTKFLPVFQTTTTTIQGRMSDLFSANLPTAGSSASTGIPLNSGTAGSINSPQTVNYSLTGNDFTIIGSEVNISTPGYWILCDRLAHSAGASATITTNQTVGLPTANLPRYTNGIGVMMGITIWTTIGSTATACRATYTNSNDVTGRLTPDITVGSSSYNQLRRFMLLPLQQGDLGVKSVQILKIDASTTTAGNFGVVLFKPLYALCGNLDYNSTNDFISSKTFGGFPQINKNACLFLLHVPSSPGFSTQGLTTLHGLLKVIDY